MDAYNIPVNLDKKELGTFYDDLVHGVYAFPKDDGYITDSCDVTVSTHTYPSEVATNIKTVVMSCETSTPYILNSDRLADFEYVYGSVGSPDNVINTQRKRKFVKEYTYDTLTPENLIRFANTVVGGHMLTKNELNALLKEASITDKVNIINTTVGPVMYSAFNKALDISSPSKLLENVDSIQFKDILKFDAFRKHRDKNSSNKDVIIGSFGPGVKSKNKALYGEHWKLTWVKRVASFLSSIVGTNSGIASIIIHGYGKNRELYNVIDFIVRTLLTNTYQTHTVVTKDGDPIAQIWNCYDENQSLSRTNRVMDAPEKVVAREHWPSYRFYVTVSRACISELFAEGAKTIGVAFYKIMKLHSVMMQRYRQLIELFLSEYVFDLYDLYITVLQTHPKITKNGEVLWDALKLMDRIEERYNLVLRSDDYNVHMRVLEFIQKHTVFYGKAVKRQPLPETYGMYKVIEKLALIHLRVSLSPDVALKDETAFYE